MDEFGPGYSCHRATHLQRKTNKRFLSNTMKSILSHNKRTTEKYAVESKRKFDEIGKRKPKFGQRTHLFRRIEERQTTKKSLS